MSGASGSTPPNWGAPAQGSGDVFGQYPSAPPVSASSWGQTSSGAPPLAGWWYRVGATVIDGLILAVISGILAAVANRAVSYTVGTLVQLLYVTLLLARPAGQTVGMMALRTRVIGAESGGPIGYGTSFVRWLVSFVLGITVIGGLINVLWPLWDRRNQTLHDKAARTLVVRTR